MALHDVVLNCIVLHCIALYRMVSYVILWYPIKLHDIACYCVVGFAGAVSRKAPIYLIFSTILALFCVGG